MTDKTYPTYQLRVSKDLLHALREAGPEKVRSVLLNSFVVQEPPPQRNPVLPRESGTTFEP